MNTTELRTFEIAIEKTLTDDFYNADRAEIDRFINSVRGHVAGRVKIVEGGDNPIIAFPSALAMPEKIHPTTKRLRQEKEDGKSAI